MITTTDMITKVKFGNGKKGNIAVGANRGILTLQQLATELQIGDGFTQDDIDKLPKIEMEFFDVRSIDVMIKALEVIKSNAIPPPSDDQLCLAC